MAVPEVPADHCSRAASWGSRGSGDALGSCRSESSFKRCGLAAGRTAGDAIVSGNSRPDSGVMQVLGIGGTEAWPKFRATRVRFAARQRYECSEPPANRRSLLPGRIEVVIGSVRDQHLTADVG